MKILTICPESFAANTYALIANGEALIVDPAVSVSAIERVLEREQARLAGILLTHGHFDHTISADTLREKLLIPLMMHKGDAPMMTDGKINGFFVFYGRESTHRPAEHLLCDGEKIMLGQEEIKVISTPGHSPGSVCFLCPRNDGFFLVTGDTLFADSIGRCDLWGGDDTIMSASLSYLAGLDQSMTIYPGHGLSANLGMALLNAKSYIDF